jgi:hypothetical protein
MIKNNDLILKIMIDNISDVVRRKIMVLDLDETLIHSHHDGLLRPTVKPGTPPDFILRVCFSFTFTFRTKNM